MDNENKLRRKCFLVVVLCSALFTVSNNEHRHGCCNEKEDTIPLYNAVYPLAHLFFTKTKLMRKLVSIGKPNYENFNAG